MPETTKNLQKNVGLAPQRLTKEIRQTTGDNTNIYPHASDKEIWQAFQQGDETAFILVYKRNFSSLYRYGSQFTKDRELIKDCIQDLFIELSEKRTRITIVSSIKFYLFKTLKHKILAYQKKETRIAQHNHSFHGFDFYFDFSIEHTMIHRQLDKEKKNKLNRAIQKLTTRQREIIYYYYHEGLSFAEIKEIMDLQQVKSAQNLLYKTIGILREQIPYGLLICILSYGMHS